MALYAVYLFLAGWSYLRHYFERFGINNGWLDFGFNETVAQGFTVLFVAKIKLSIIYLLVVLISLLVEVILGRPNRILNTIVACLLIAFFPLVYTFAGEAGSTQADVDRGGDTHLPTLDFTAGSCSYIGKLVYVKGDLVYVHNLQLLSSSNAPKPQARPETRSQACPFDLEGASSEVPQLWLIRSADIKDARIIHYK